MKPSKYNLILVGILILASALMLFRLETKSYWDDEMFSVLHAQKDPWAILIGQGEPGNPPLHFLLLHYWLVFGTSEFATRFLSVIFGLLSVYAMYRVGRLFFDERVGLLSAFLLSLSHLFIGEAQEARTYTLFLLLSLASVYFFYRMMTVGKRIYVVFYIASTLLALCSHYFALFVFFAEILFLVFRRAEYKASKLRVFQILAVIFILYLPFFIPFLGNALGRVESNIRDENFMKTREFWGFEPSTMIYGTLATFSNTKYAIPLFLLPLLYGLFVYYKQDKDQYSFMFLWFMVPVITVLVLSAKMALMVKYILFALPPFLALVSKGLIGLKNKYKYLQFFILSLILLSAATKLVDYYDSEKPDWRSAVAYVDTNFDDGVVVVEPGWSLKYFTFYSNRNISNVIGVTEDDTSSTKTEEVCATDSEVWVVYSWENKILDREGKVMQWLEGNCQRKKKVYDITIYLCTH